MENVPVQENIPSRKNVLYCLDTPERARACQNGNFSTCSRVLDKAFQIILFVERNISIKSINWNKFIDGHAIFVTLDSPTILYNWKIFYEVISHYRMI